MAGERWDSPPNAEQITASTVQIDRSVLFAMQKNRDLKMILRKIILKFEYTLFRACFIAETRASFRMHKQLLSPWVTVVTRQWRKLFFRKRAEF